MIDELVLEQLLAELGRGDRGTTRRRRARGAASSPLRAGRSTRRPSPRLGRALMVAAVVAVVAGIGLLMQGSTKPTARVAVAVPTSVRRTRRRRDAPRSDNFGVGGLSRGTNGPAGAQGRNGRGGSGRAPGQRRCRRARKVRPASAHDADDHPVEPFGTRALTESVSETAPIDGALVVKTGSLDLQVPTTALRPTINRVTTTVVGLGGYVVNQNASYTSTEPTGTITMRVPVNRFEAAVSDINGLPGVKVLGDRETGKDVTAQYVNVQAQITALTTEEQSILKLLAQANNLNDILNLHDASHGDPKPDRPAPGAKQPAAQRSGVLRLAITDHRRPSRRVTSPCTPRGITRRTRTQQSLVGCHLGFRTHHRVVHRPLGGALIVLLATLSARVRDPLPLPGRRERALL